MRCYICLYINKLGNLLQIFCYKKAGKHFIVKKEWLRKVKQWELSETSLDVKNGDVVSISSSICKKLYDKRQTLNLDL